MPYQTATGLKEQGAGYLGDEAQTYADWAAQVKANGGVAVNWPFDDADYGKPAARYPLATYVDLYNNGMITDSDNVQRSGTGDYAYVVADSDVAAAAQSLTGVTAREAAGLPGAFNFLNPFANLSTSGKWMTGAAVATAGVMILGLLRGRDR